MLGLKNISVETAMGLNGLPVGGRNRRGISPLLSHISMIFKLVAKGSWCFYVGKTVR